MFADVAAIGLAAGAAAVSGGTVQREDAPTPRRIGERGGELRWITAPVAAARLMCHNTLLQPFQTFWPYSTSVTPVCLVLVTFWPIWYTQHIRYT